MDFAGLVLQYPMPSELYITWWKGPAECMVDFRAANALRPPQCPLSPGHGEFFGINYYIKTILKKCLGEDSLYSTCH